MYLSFLWCSKGLSPAAARERFLGILDFQCKLYSDAWGISATATLHQQDTLFIGQIYSDPGVRDWQPWVEHECGGLVWNGVCETFLGSGAGAEVVQTILTSLDQSPQHICSWDGRFYVISWDRLRDTVCLTTGATECPTLWYTQGPHGWAAGSRGAPILEMVGREKQLSEAACNVFLAYGYNYSNASLLEQVQRVPQRTRIVIKPGVEPVISRYATLADYFGTVESYTDRNDILDVCTERLVARVGRQLEYSSDPEILITGGRDSRAIAAAAKQVGYAGVVSTGGPAGSSDVVIGEAVANRLQLAHLHTPDRVPMMQFGEALDRLKLWTTMSEGTEVLRHARAYNRFVAGELQPLENRQLFHGLGGEICRGYYYKGSVDIKQLGGTDYSIGRRILLAGAAPGVPLTRGAIDLLEARWDDFSQDIAASEVAVTEWLDLFFWQNSCLRWGEDMLSVKSAMYWAWTPFIDRILISNYRALDPEDKYSNRFIEELVLRMCNELAGLGYDQLATNRQSASRIFMKTLRRLKGSVVPQARTELTVFWEAVLLGLQNPVWKNFLKEDTVRQLIINEPASEILWNAATLELVADAYPHN